MRTRVMQTETYDSESYLIILNGITNSTANNIVRWQIVGSAAANKILANIYYKLNER